MVCEAHPEFYARDVATRRTSPHDGSVPKAASPAGHARDPHRRSTPMSTHPAPPMDDATRTAIAAVEKLVVTKALREAAARSLLAAIAAERHAVTMQAAQHPAAEIARRIAQLQQAHPGLSPAQALEQVAHEEPALWDRHVAAQRKGERPAPVVKAALPSDAQMLKTADAQVAQQPGLTRHAALMALVKAHPDKPAYDEAYGRYHVREGLWDHDNARLAALKAGR